MQCLVGALRGLPAGRRQKPSVEKYPPIRGRVGSKYRVLYKQKSYYKSLINRQVDCHAMKIKAFITEVIAALLILLFVYTALSKLIDYEVFRMQLMQSPLLKAFAWLISWGLPLTEIVVVSLLLMKKTRLLGLFSALALMTMFTTYIIILLNYSRVIPCSCGGILAALSWSQHLFVNLFFVLISMVGILLCSLPVTEKAAV